MIFTMINPTVSRDDRTQCPARPVTEIKKTQASSPTAQNSVGRPEKSMTYLEVRYLTERIRTLRQYSK
jgi:hypothetical protein